MYRQSNLNIRTFIHSNILSIIQIAKDVSPLLSKHKDDIALNENFKIANFARKRGILLNKTDLEKVSKYLDINLI